MSAKINIAGDRFGKLIAIKPTGKRTEGGGIIWLCECDCGNTAKVAVGYLRAGRYRSCGCAQWDNNRKPPKESAKRRVFCSYRSGARRSERTFGITYGQFLEITQKKCFYCGREPKKVMKPHPIATLIHNNPDYWYIYNGIDRIDNSVGYTLDNCVPCCTECNFLKRDKDYYKFMSTVLRIADHQRRVIA